MTPKDFLYLTHIRKDLKFFWNRLIIGFILAFSVIYSGVIDPNRVIQEIQDKQLFLYLVVLFMCIPMYLVYRIRPANKKISTLQKKSIALCEAITSVIRSALIMGISTLITCMIVEKNIVLIVHCLNFFMFLEQTSYIHNQWDAFEYTADHELLFSFVVGEENKEESKGK